MDDMKFQQWNEISSTEATRNVDRLGRRARAVQPPEGLPDGEAYRTWLYERVARLSKADQTEGEREETRQWRDRIGSASVDALWAEYSQLNTAS